MQPIKCPECDEVIGFLSRNIDPEVVIPLICNNCKTPPDAEIK